MSNLAIRYGIENLRSIAFGSLSTTFMGIGSAILNPARQLLFVNTTDALVIISDDGVNDKFVLTPFTSFIDDVASNRAEPGGNLSAAQGTRYYVRTTGTPTEGAVYLTAFYGAGVLP